MTNVDIAKKYFKDKVFKINDKIFGEYELLIMAIIKLPYDDKYEIIIRFEKDKFSSANYIREVLKYHLNMFGIVNFKLHIDHCEEPVFGGYP
jgi:fructose/tagatose bisphosphate aldolase